MIKGARLAVRHVCRRPALCIRSAPRHRRSHLRGTLGRRAVVSDHAIARAREVAGDGEVHHAATMRIAVRSGTGVISLGSEVPHDN